jgi:hypothetical protein
LQELENRNEVNDLTKCLRSHSEVGLVTLEKSIDEEIREQLDCEHTIDNELDVNPVCNEVSGVGEIYLSYNDAKNVKDTNNIDK